MKIKYSILAILFVVVTMNPLASAETINPQSYYSTDENYSIHVEPVNKNGIGSAHYTYRENNAVLWDITLDQTFVDVIVSSEGHVFAFSYSLGLDADYFTRQKGEQNNLTLWMLNKQGDIVFKQEHERGLEPQPPHQNDRPICYGIMLNEHTDTVAFRLTPYRENTEKLEQWHQFSATTGERKPDLFINFDQEKHYDGASIEHILTIPGTDYFLIEMRQSVYEESKASSRGMYGYLSDSLFYVINSVGEVVWRDVNLADLRFEHDSKLGRQWDKYLDHNALIGYDKAGHQFSIQHLKSQEVIYYGFNKSNQIVEKSRKPFEVFVQDNGQPKVEEEPPKLLYTIELEKPAQKAKLPARFTAFDINENNQIGTLVSEQDSLYFYLLGADNKILKKIPVQISLNKHKITAVVSMGDGQWRFLASRYNENSRLFKINIDSSEFKEILIDAPGGGRMVVDEHGNITVLASEGGDYLRQFDQQGKTLWTSREDEYGKVGYLSSPSDITLTGHNQLIVLDHIGNKLNFYDLAGQPIKTIKFKDTRQGELSYPSLLRVIDDVIYVEDNDDATVIHRYSMEGQWLDKYHLKINSGQKLNHIQDMQLDSDGHIWISDNGLYGFDDLFNNVSYVGQSQQQKLFNHISALQANSKGDIYLFNGESFSVIQISAQDGTMKVFSLSVDQIPTDSILTSKMLIDQNNQVYINLGRCQYAVFNARGKYLKNFKSALKCGKYHTIDLVTHSGGTLFWKEKDDTITLEKYQGNTSQVLKTITKDSNGHWLNRVSDLVTDKKGRLIASGDRSDGLRKQDRVIYVFDEKGSPLSTFPVKEYVSSLTFSGNYIYLNFSNEQHIRVFNLNGQPVTSFSNVNDQQDDCTMTLLYADEVNNRLYVYAGKTLSVYELL